MPTWLVHGFRWPRQAIRIHIILHNLEDCAPGWVMAPDTVAELTESFQTLYPERMAQLPNLRFIEQYDPEDETASDQPYAYVCDQVHEIKLGADIDELKGPGVQGQACAALVELQNELAPLEKLKWFIVVNGDPERWAPPMQEDEEEALANGKEERQPSPVSQRTSVGKPEEDDVEQGSSEQRKGGFKAWLGKVKKARSSKDLKADVAIRSSPMAPPPLPKGPQAITNPRRANGKAAV